MYAWVAFPLLRITLLFAAGIVLAVELPPSASRESIALGLTVLFVIYCLIWKLFQRTRFFSLNLLFGATGHLLIVILGYTVLLFHNDQYDSNHLLYQQDVLAYKVMITGEPDDKGKSIRALGNIVAAKDSTGWKPVSGKLFIYIRKGENISNVAYGDVLLVQGNPDPTQSPKNPGEFDYQLYLSYQNIFHQDFITIDEFVIVERQAGFLLYSFAIRSREYLKKILYKHIPSDRERAIALALLLGTKDELTPEINAAYSSAGAMHVLAVSGLHVGIIYGLMLLFFKKSQKGKVMKWVFLVVTLCGLWSYALITGLSASVLRAVTMFSLMTVAKVAKRESNIYNTLSIAGLILLCYDPYMIMSVGFQLSFLAVFGIVYITPKIYQLLIVDQYFLDKMWQVTCVSVAAQIATASLVLLYFHQFPTYFFLSNLVVIPAAFAILVSGISLFLLEMVPYASDIIGWVLKWLIYLTNEFVFLIDRLPNNTIDNVYISTTQSWLIIVSIVLFFGWLYYKQLYQLVMLSLVIFTFVVIQGSRAIKNLQNKEIIFYSIGRHTAIDFLQGGYATLIADSTLLSSESKLRFHIKPKRLRAGISHPIVNRPKGSLVKKKVGANELIVWNDRRILILRDDESLIENIQVGVLVVTNNSIYNLEQLSKITYEVALIDGSNSRYRVNRLMKQAAQKDNIINLIENGAYTISL